MTSRMIRAREVRGAEGFRQGLQLGGLTMHKFVISALCVLLAGASSAAFAAPLSVRIDDHDFSFDVPYYQPSNWGAMYDFAGTGADTLSIASSNPNHYVEGYSYTGKLPTVSAVPYGAPPAPYAFPYPVANSTTFGGDLQLNMQFDVNDGPYVDAGTGDVFDISLVGNVGSLKITGQIYAPGFTPLYPAAPSTDIVLLEIDFNAVTLLSRIGEDRIFLIEGKGVLKTLLGHDVSQEPGLPEVGVTFFKFFAENPQVPIFTDPNYQPSDDVQGQILGRISGEAGAIPEPVSLTLLGLGSLALLRRRRR